MRQNMVNVEAIAGKTVEKVTVTDESDFRDISIRFTDKTGSHFEFFLTLSV
jgi:hypothetical protein